MVKGSRRGSCQKVYRGSAAAQPKRSPRRCEREGCDIDCRHVDGNCGVSQYPYSGLFVQGDFATAIQV